jgi:hypothetical protein
MEKYTSEIVYSYIGGGINVAKYTSTPQYSIACGGTLLSIFESERVYLARPLPTPVFSPKVTFNLLSTVLYAWGKSEAQDVSFPKEVVTLKTILWDDVTAGSFWSPTNVTGTWNGFYWTSYQPSGIYFPEFIFDSSFRPNYVRITYIDVSEITVEVAGCQVSDQVYEVFNGIATTTCSLINTNNTPISSLRITPTNVISNNMIINKIEFGV